MATQVAKEADAGDLATFVSAAHTALDGGSSLTFSIGSVEHVADERLSQVVLQLLGLVATGATVELDDLPRRLTTGQAADLLGVSRPTVAALVDAGDLPATMVGTHRRIELVELLAYREQRRIERRSALDEITRSSQELGLYETG